MSGPSPWELPAEARKSAERLLSRRFGRRTRISGQEVMNGGDAGALVFRLHLTGESAPATALLKLGQGPEGRPFDPRETASDTPAVRFHNDWSGAMLLNDVQPKDAPLALAVLGADRELGLLLLEDLGAHESLADILIGEDPDRAEQAVLEFARTLGKVGARTAAHFEDYQRLRKAFRSPPQGPAKLRASVRATVGQVYETFEEVGFEWTPELVDDIEQVSAAMQDPGPFYTYIHGDACPGNDLLVAGGVRMLNFESGGFGHALLDGASIRFLFPACWCVSRLPPALVERAESLYRYELAKGVAAAEDDDAFFRSMTEACAYWFIVTSAWHLREALRFDRNWGTATLRQRLVLRSGLLARTCRELGHLPALGAFAAAVHDRLRVEWPTLAEMPLYPAFRSSGPAG